MYPKTNFLNHHVVVFSGYSVRRKLLSAKIPLGEYSFGENSFGESSIGENSGHDLHQSRAR